MELPINDVCNIDSDCFVKLYADDTEVFVYDSSLKQIRLTIGFLLINLVSL